MTEQKKWGFLRETDKKVEVAKKYDPTGYYETLDRYLTVIFPNTTWKKNKGCGIIPPNNKESIRPDYHSESLKLIIEIDGLQHYQNPQNIIQDELRDKACEKKGYKVVRIPYFIQLTNEVVKTMFGVEVKETLFDPNIPSFVDPATLVKEERPNTPAYACPLGVRRMAQEFKKYPQQYEINLKALRDMDNPDLSGIDFLEAEYNKLQD